MAWETQDIETDAATAVATLPTPRPKSRPRAQRNRSGNFLRAKTGRPAMQELLHRSKLLPETPRAILRAYLELNMPLEELALLHKLPPRLLARRIRRWKELLADPDFLLAAQYGPCLQPPLAAFAAAYWVDGQSLRTLASAHGVTLHHVRAQLTRTRLELVKTAAAAALQL